MERRIPIRRLVYAGACITGHRGALATMERKLDDFRLFVLVVLTGFLRVNPPFHGGKKSAGSGHLGHSSSNNKPIIITFLSQ